MHDPTQRHPAGNRVPKGSSSRAGFSEDTPSLFEDAGAAVGRRRRDDGQRHALAGADLRWKAAAEDALADLARSGVEFTADDLHARVATLASSPNALGGIIGAAARRGEIEVAGIATSTRPERHGGLQRRWRGVGGGA